MTVREIYDNLLSELNKEEFPSLLLVTFNYLLGKAINEECNLWYNRFEETQLLTDNLRVLTRSTTIRRATISGGNYYQLPLDYWHMLPTCLVTFERNDGLDPCNRGSSFYTFQKPAIKLNSQMNSGILGDYYTKPSYKRPYFLLHEYQDTVVLPEPSRSVTTTYGIEIRSGSTDVYIPNTIKIDYLKLFKLPKFVIDHTTRIEDPNNIYLTQDELESEIDNSAIMEFPDNFCYEIINKLTALVMENSGDPRIGNNIPLNQSMIPPPK